MPDRPNILLFLSDDHGAWASGAYGNAETHTPSLDALASLGTRFTNAFTPTPVCSPARACLLTGKAASQVGIHDWLEEAITEVGERDWLGDTSTLFEYLSAAGYHTGLSGKWHLGQSHLPPRGADYHFGLPGWQGAHNSEYTYVRNGQTMLSAENKSRLISDHAIDFLDTVPAGKPFFLNIGYIATHSPYVQSAHDPAQTARYQDCAFAEIPPYAQHAWVRNEGGGNDLSEQDLRDRYIGYYAAVSEIDDNIARIVGALQMRGLWGKTIIIYTSDHGLALGHKGFFGKGNSTRPLNMYEISLRVPLIIAGPGIEAQSLDHYVDHCDTFHTICQLAQISPPADSYAGQSYAELLRGEEMAWDNTRYGEYGDLRMIRDERWKLILRYPAGPHELFDLRADPAETVSVYDEHADLVAAYRARLEAFYARHEVEALSGLNVKRQPRHNGSSEAWRDGKREARGLQIY